MSLFSLLSVSASGMSAQRTRAELLVENLANSETTRTPDGGPYRRKDAVFATDSPESPFSSVFEAQLGRPDGVRVAEVRETDRHDLLPRPRAVVRMDGEDERAVRGESEDAELVLGGMRREVCHVFLRPGK